MKVKLEFEMTPKEFRESLGLPDVAGLQEKVIKGLQSRITSDAKDINVSKLVEGWLTQGISTSRQIQGLFGAVMSGVMDGGKGDKKGEGKDKKD